jgi:hypothetical protein
MYVARSSDRLAMRRLAGVLSSSEDELRAKNGWLDNVDMVRS